jgi:hypothetical protein
MPKYIASYISSVHKLSQIDKSEEFGLTPLAKAQAQFDVLVTSDKNLPFQQDLRQFALAVAVLDVPSNRIEDCLPKMPTLLKIKDMIEALETRGGCYLWENVKAEASTWRAKSKSNCQSDRAVR